MYNCKLLQENVTKKNEKKEEKMFTIILHAESKLQNNVHRIQRVIVELSVDLLSKSPILMYDFLASEKEIKYSDVTTRCCAWANGISWVSQRYSCKYVYILRK